MKVAVKIVMCATAEIHHRSTERSHLGSVIGSGEWRIVKNLLPWAFDEEPMVDASVEIVFNIRARA
jgi:hypothetical protein